MAAKKDVVYLSLYLDTAKAEKAYQTLITLQGELEAKLAEARKKATAGGVDPKEDPMVKMLDKQLKNIKSVSRQFNAANREIAKAATDMSQMATSAISSLIRNVEKRLDGLKGKARESAKANELREILANLKRERETRGVSAGYGLTMSGLEKESANTPKNIENLKRLLEHFKAFRDYTKSTRGREKANTFISQLEAEIKQMETAPLRKVKDVFNDVKKSLSGGGSIENLKALREELIRIRDASGDKKTTQLAVNAIADIDQRVKSLTTATISAKQAEKDYKASQKAIANGTSERAETLRHLIVQMQLAQKAEGISVADAQKYAQAEKEMTQTLKEQERAVLSLSELKKMAAKSDGSIQSIQKLREEYVRFLNAAQSQGDRNQALNAIAGLDKQLKEMQTTPLRNLSDVLKDLYGANNINRLNELKTELKALQGNTSDKTQLSQIAVALKEVDASISMMQSAPLRSVSAVLKDFAAGGNSIQRLQDLKNELLAIQKTTTDSGSLLAASDGIKKIDAEITKMQTAPLRSLGDVLNDLGKKGNSLNQLKELKTELEAIRGVTTDKGQLGQIAVALNQIDKATKEMQSEPLRRVTTVLNEIKAGGHSIQRLKELKAELLALQETSTSKHALPAIADGLKQIDAEIARMQSAPLRDLTTLLNDLSSGAKSIGELKVLRAEFVALQNATTNKGDLEVIAKNLKDIDKAIAEMQTAPMRSLNEVLNDLYSKTNSVAGLRELKSELLGLQNLETSRSELDKIARAMDFVNKQTKELTTTVLTAAEADDLYQQAQKVLQEGIAGQASKARELAQAMKQAAQAEGISVGTAQLYTKTGKEINDLLTKEVSARMTSAEAMTAYNYAQNLLLQGVNASASEVQQYIDLLGRAQQIEGISVAEKQMYAAKQKELSDQLNKSAIAYMDYAQIQAVVAKGEEAEVSEINLAISSLKNLSQAEGTTAKQAKEYAEVIKVLESRTRAASGSSQKFAYDAKFVADTLHDIDTTSIANLDRAIKMCEQRVKELDRADEDAFNSAKEDLMRLRAEYDKATKGVGKHTEEVKKTNTAFQQQGDFITKAATKLMNYLGIFGGFYLVRQKLTEAFQANLKYDDSLTNIRKTTGLTAEAVEMLADNIKRIDTRTSLDEITNLAYAAGKLGVKGVSDVMAFTRAANQINIALGEQLNGAESVEQIMKIVAITGERDMLGTEQSLLKVGSAINYLTMNSQAVAQPIVDFMKRTAGIATQAGITASELTGLAGAVNALGQPVEMSATSFSKMIVQMEKNSTAVAKALNMNKAEEQSFKDLLRTGHAMDAFLEVLKRTRELGGISHLSTIVKDLGSEGQRVIQTIATLSANYDKVADMVKMSNQAYKEGTSVTDEYNIKNQNTAALLERLKNGFSKLMVSPEAIRWIRELLRDLQGLPNAVRDIVDAFSWFGNVLGGVLKVLAKFPSLFGGILYYITGKSIIAGLKNIWQGIINIRNAWIAARAAGQGFFATMKSMMSTNIFGLILTAVGTLVAHLQMARAEAKRMAKEVADSFTRVREQAKTEAASIQTLANKYKEAGDNMSQRKTIIDEMNKQYGEYLNNILNEKMSWQEVADVLETVNKQLQLKSYLEGKQKALADVEQENAEDKGDARIALREAIAKMLPGFADDKDAARATASVIVDELLKKDKNGQFVADRYLRKTEEDGKVEYHDPTSYLKTGGSKETDNALLRALGEFLETYDGVVGVRKNANDNVVLATSETREVASKLYEYMEVQAKIQNRQAAISAAFDPEIARLSGEIGTFYKDQVKEGWKEVQAAVMGGMNIITNNVTTKAEEAVEAIEGEAKTATDETAKTASESVRKGFENVVVPVYEEYEGNGVARKANNPGNLRGDTSGLATGIYTTEKGSKYAKFGNLEDGFYAMGNQLLRYLDGRFTGFGHKNPTIDEIINKYAPKADNNKTEAYIKRVSEAMNVSKDVPVPISYTALKSLMTAMAFSESNMYKPQELEAALERLFNDYIEAGGVLDDNDVPIVFTASREESQIGSGKGAMLNAMRSQQKQQAEEQGFATGAFAKYYTTGEFQMLKQDELRWAAQRDEMNDEQRNEEIARMEKALAPLSEWLDDLKKNVANQGVDQSKWTQEFKDAYAQKALIEGYLKILKLGELNEEDAAQLKKANEDYNTLVKYLDEFYKERAAIIGEQRINKEITETTKTSALRGNDIDRHTSREIAFRTITGRNKETDWVDQQAAIEKEMNDIIAQLPKKILEDGTEVVEDVYLDLVENLRLAFGQIKGVQNLRTIGEVFEKDDKRNTGEAKLAKISSDAAEDDRQIRVINNKKAEEATKAWLERNPMGKISKQFQEEFEKLGLMLTDMTKQEGMSLQQVAQQTMENYLKIGKEAVNYDITNEEGLERFRQYCKELPLFAKGAQDAAVEMLRDIYYKSYEYYEQYSEQMQRLTDRTMKMWQKMYDKSKGHLDLTSDNAEIQKLVAQWDKLEKYGSSDRMELYAKVQMARNKAEDALNGYNDKVGRVNSHILAANALKEGDTYIDSNGEKQTVTAEYIKSEKDTAQAEFDALASEALKVEEAYTAVIDAQEALRDATLEWVSDMEGAFEKFMDGFVPFRSWYEDNGSLSANIFGTKEERQEAFGAFMDDVKKTVRESIMEHVRLRMTRAIQERLMTDDAKKQELARLIFKKAKKTEEVVFTQTADAAEKASNDAKTVASNANAMSAATTELTAKSGEVTGVVLANEAEAVSKSYAQLGPIAGSVAVGVLTAVIGAFLTMALNALGGGKSKGTAAAAPKTKLVSGMLTYDRGNVQSWGVRTYDDGNTVNYVQGDNGTYYAVQSRDVVPTAPHGLVTRPTLTNIGGTPALIAENGPEMVIGRETTKAMQMNDPQLFRTILAYDRNHSAGFVKTFDSGNTQTFSAEQIDGMTQDEMKQIIMGNQEALAQSAAVNAALVEQLSRGIHASFNVHGAGGALDVISQAAADARRKGEMKYTKRLIG